MLYFEVKTTNSISMMFDLTRLRVLSVVYYFNEKKKSLINTSQSCFFVGLSLKDDDCDLPLFSINIQRNITGAARCSTKPLSKILTSIFTVYETDLR